MFRLRSVPLYLFYFILFNTSFKPDAHESSVTVLAELTATWGRSLVQAQLGALVCVWLRNSPREAVRKKSIMFDVVYTAKLWGTFACILYRVYGHFEICTLWYLVSSTAFGNCQVYALAWTPCYNVWWTVWTTSKSFYLFSKFIHAIIALLPIK